jgi:hypothetical protein
MHPPSAARYSARHPLTTLEHGDLDDAGGDDGKAECMGRVSTARHVIHHIEESILLRGDPLSSSATSTVRL